MKSLPGLLALLLTVASSSCASPVNRRSFQAPGQTAVRVTQSLWSDDRVDSDSISMADEVHATELQFEHTIAEGWGLVAGIGSRNYQFEPIPDFTTTEATLGFRSYSLPFSERVIGYFAGGVRYGDLPGSEYSVDLDTGFGVVFPFDGFHIDLNITRGIALTGGNVPLLENFERNHAIVSIGAGWSFGSGD